MTRATYAAPLAVLTAALLPAPGLAQTEPTARSTKALALLDGVWSGPAWVFAPNGKRYAMQQTETVCPAIFGQIRVMEGRGQMGGETRFHAVTIFESRADGTISMRSYTTGRMGEYPITLRNDGFEWSHEMDGRLVRYRICIEAGVWREMGERRTGDGSGWEPIFGMELGPQADKGASCITSLDAASGAQ